MGPASYKKVNKLKPQLNRVGRPGKDTLTPCNDSRAQREEERLRFFPGKDSANEKPQTLFLLQNPTLLFFFYKAFSFPCPAGTCTWLAIVADPEFQFSAAPE